MIHRTLIVMVVSFLISFSSLLLFVNLVDLQPGESIGKGWYLLKSYSVSEGVEDGTEYVQRNIEHGDGAVNISLLFSLVVGALYAGIRRKKNRKIKTS